LKEEKTFYKKVYYIKPIIRNRVTKVEFTQTSERGLALKG